MLPTYDLQEPFRWIIDVSVIQAFESGALSLHDFYFTGDDYRFRFEAEAKQRFIDVLRERFNAGLANRGRVLKWDTNRTEDQRVRPILDRKVICARFLGT